MDHDFYTKVQKQLDAAMPWVGLYITAASAVCILLMAADAFNGFRCKKLWFPCKYFSLNATSLTLLAVTMKLPMDLNTIMIKSDTDAAAKFMSLTFMSTAMTNFMPSLGSMNDKEILANVVALSILVITIIGNVCIQLIELWRFLKPGTVIFAIIVPSILLLVSLATLVSLAITVSTTKRSLESKYQEKHKVALSEEEALHRRGAFRIDDQRGYMMKYWVMAESCSPQFVMARSAVCTSSSVICFFALIISTTVGVLLYGPRAEGRGESPYGNYTKWITNVQFTGRTVGTIAPMLRWFVVVIFRCSTTNGNSFRKGSKIEAHWIQTLVDWSVSFSVLQQNKCWKHLHDVKWYTLTFCIRVQILVVLVSKILVFLSAVLVSPFLLCFTHIKKFVKQIGHVSGGDTDQNLSRYVLLLEGEAELPRRFLQNICCEADHMIQTGRKKQSESLVNLLHKFASFNGVGQFDSNQIPSLHSQEASNCWTLPVVTLTSIAVALPNIAKHKRKQLLSSVSEGLFLAKIVEKTLDKSAELKKIRKAADVTWVGVVLYMKWLENIDLKRTSLQCKNSKKVLEEFSSKAEAIIMEFRKEVQDPIMENPLNWPAKVLAANSMYRVSRTMLLSCEEESEHTDEGLFERMSIMIADILAACLTNLPHAITTMCHHNAIEKRGKSIRKAFLLLGKTEQIVELLQQQEWPYLDHDKAAYIEEWRALFQQDQDDPAASTSSYESVASTPVSSSEEYLVVTIDC